MERTSCHSILKHELIHTLGENAIEKGANKVTEVAGEEESAATVSFLEKQNT